MKRTTTLKSGARCKTPLTSTPSSQKVLTSLFLPVTSGDSPRRTRDSSTRRMEGLLTMAEATTVGNCGQGENLSWILLELHATWHGGSETKTSAVVVNVRLPEENNSQNRYTHPSAEGRRKVVWLKGGWKSKKKLVF